MCLLYSGGQKADTLLTVYGIKGPSGIAMIRMFEEPPQIEGYEVRLEALSQADLIAGRLISGEAKMGMLPPNLAAKIASSGKNIQIAAVTGTGMLSLLSSDTELHSIEGLRGKRVEIANPGTVPDYVFRRLILNRGLDPENDLTLGYALSSPEIAASLISGRISTALLPEPFSSMVLAGSPGLRRIGDIQDEWKNAYGGDYPITVLAVDGDFADAHPRAVDAVLRSLEDSVRWVVSHPVEAGILAEKHGMGIPSGIAAEAIPRSNYVFMSAVSARPLVEALFRVFLEFSPQSIGAMPGENFYYQRQP